MASILQSVACSPSGINTLSKAINMWLHEFALALLDMNTVLLESFQHLLQVCQMLSFRLASDQCHRHSR